MINDLHCITGTPVAWRYCSDDCGDQIGNGRKRQRIYSENHFIEDGVKGGKDVSTDDDLLIQSKKNSARRNAPLLSFTDGVKKEEDEDDDDALLIKEAGAWVEQANDDCIAVVASTDVKVAVQNSSSNTISCFTKASSLTWSVHITQIVFTATQLDLHHHFTSHHSVGGCCRVKSIRLVYDKGIDTHRQFRGVAFVDLADEESYRLALKLDRSILLGRKIHVRPTKSSTELSQIVKETRERVATKIRASMKRQHEHVKESFVHDTKMMIRSRTIRKQRNSSLTPKLKCAKQEDSAAKKIGTVSKSPLIHSERISAQSLKVKRKLTKKDRNRRAAILLQKRNNHKL